MSRGTWARCASCGRATYSCMRTRCAPKANARGTARTAPGQGATLAELFDAVLGCEVADGVAPALARLAELGNPGFPPPYTPEQKGENFRHPSNLRLTGDALTVSDLKRIAKCEVAR